MKYNNPVLKGFYPDPSVCKVEDTYYMVCSSFQYFPGVPLFESKDLINWHKIGHCLTRESQIQLSTVDSSGGVFAPTIRYNNGRFYMVTTNNTNRKNFYVYTDDIYGEWSEPIYVDQDGIDPSLLFDEGKVYFLSTGVDDEGIDGIIQCEIDIESGKKLTKSKVLWLGSGGRYVEGPHMYKINGKYYLMAAEGGTEYGHMITYAVGDNPWGEFKNYPGNPVLTNRNLGGYEIQGIGHGDLVEDNNGNWWIVHLGFRQIGQYEPYHHLGREVFLAPVKFHEDGWFTAGDNGVTARSFEIDFISEDVVQEEKKSYTFENTEWDNEWYYIRHPKSENYELLDNKVVLKGTEVTLDDIGSPTFIGMHQKDFKAEIKCEAAISKGEGGITIYMDENHHYDLAIRKVDNVYEVVEKLNIGDIKSVENKVSLGDVNKAELIIRSDNKYYNFFVNNGTEEIALGRAQTRYLSSEVAGGFTGVLIGLYALGDNNVNFENFNCKYI